MCKFLCESAVIKERTPEYEYPHTSEKAERAGKVIQTGETVTIEITLRSSGDTTHIPGEVIGFDVLNKLRYVADGPAETQR